MAVVDLFVPISFFWSSVHNTVGIVWGRNALHPPPHPTPFLPCINAKTLAPSPALSFLPCPTLDCNGPHSPFHASPYLTSPPLPPTPNPFFSPFVFVVAVAPSVLVIFLVMFLVLVHFRCLC